MAERITSVMVAEVAGVSQAAVSRVFTPGASVSKKTAEKVRRAANQLGYRPNSLARAMVSGKSRIIGLVVAYLDNYFYPDAVENLSNAFQKRGYHVLVFMASNTADKIDSVMQEILDYQVDGIVLASVALSSEITKRCKENGVPVVLFNRSQDNPNISAVTSDNYKGGAEVANLLLKDGHEKIAYLAGWEGASTQRDREAGFVDALRKAGKSIVSRSVGNFRTEQTREAALSLFNVPVSKRPDAIFVANDHMALTTMDVIRFSLNLSIPNDVAIVGFDDVPPASWPAYNLTTVRQRANKMVECTVDIILEKIEQSDNGKSIQIKIPSPIVVRGTTRNLEGEI